jgi:enoyl-CoA hydratase
MEDIVSLQKFGVVCVLTINRPEVRNAVDGSVAKALAAQLIQFDKDAELLVAVLRGKDGMADDCSIQFAHYPGCFCAGANLKIVSGGSPENQLNIQPVQTINSGNCDDAI